MYATKGIYGKNTKKTIFFHICFRDSCFTLICRQCGRLCKGEKSSFNTQTISDIKFLLCHNSVLNLFVWCAFNCSGEPHKLHFSCFFFAKQNNVYRRKYLYAYLLSCFDLCSLCTAIQTDQNIYKCILLSLHATSVIQNMIYRDILRI